MQLTDTSERGVLELGPDSSGVASVSSLCLTLRLIGLYPALRMAAMASFRSSLSSTPAAFSLKSVRSASAAGVLYVLYLRQTSISISISPLSGVHEHFACD